MEINRMHVERGLTVIFATLAGMFCAQILSDSMNSNESKTPNMDITVIESVISHDGYGMDLGPSSTTIKVVAATPKNYCEQKTFYAIKDFEFGVQALNEGDMCNAAKILRRGLGHYNVVVNKCGSEMYEQIGVKAENAQSQLAFAQLGC